MNAAHFGNVEMVKLLLDKGADPSVVSATGWSALKNAETNGFPEIVRLIKASLSDRPPEAAARPRPPEPEQRGTYRSDVDTPSYRRPPDASRFAVVIGIEKYIDLPEARFAERDAEAVRRHLEALGYPSRNIMSLTGERASRAGLEKAFETWLPLNVPENGEVFVYYSGHGAPDPSSGQAYLLPRDGDPEFLKNTGYPLKRLYEHMGRLKARKTLVVLDSCFSGAGGRSVLAKGTRPLVTRVDLGAPASDRLAIMSASSADQISGTEEAQGHGLFTYYLLRGLNGAASGGDGSVTLGSAFEYIRPNVQDEARRRNRAQTPELVGGQTNWLLRAP